jgi:hypothetical protein
MTFAGDSAAARGETVACLRGLRREREREKGKGWPG